MKTITLIALASLLVAPAIAGDLGSRAPAKPTTEVTPSSPDPDVIRQGGDTFDAAVALPIPAVDIVGSTTGYNDDYGDYCPWDSWAPDVVYSIVPDQDITIDIDLYGSSYDTKIYVYDQNLIMIACNDDAYPDYTSLIEDLPVFASQQYFVVIDGFGSDHGDYLLNIREFAPCVLDCPAGAGLEDEPPLVDGYVDNHNGGCNANPFNPVFQPITTPVFCGRSGWFIGPDGDQMRDTDWFTLVIPPSGTLEIIGDAEQDSYMLEIGPQDCDAVGVIQEVPIGSCFEASMTMTGAPGSVVWFWVGPAANSGPGGAESLEYGYVLWTNLTPVATQAVTWSGVKALFN